MWNATNSNFYAQIMDSLANFFGRKPEETTEAELHQELTEARTKAEMAEQAKAEGLATAASELDALRADVARLTAELADAVETAQTASANLETVSAELVTAQTELTAANSALAQKVKDTNTLAGEVARLTAGKPPKGASAQDDDEQFEKAPVGNGRTVSADWLEKSFFGSKN
jgi:chromosome segregation ATPase